MTAKKRLRPLWVILHWLMALLIFATFGIGLLSLVNRPNTDEKLVPLGIHMALGMLILLMVIARYLLRILVFSPPKRAASTPNPLAKKQPFLDQLSVYVHPLLYLFTALMALVGIALALPAELFSTIFTRSGMPLPADFYIYPARAWHGTLSLVLMVLIGQHLLAAVFHQFIRGENFLGRMWFTRSK